MLLVFFIAPKIISKFGEERSTILAHIPRILAVTIPAISLLFMSPAWAIVPFTVKDIRVEGIQRTEAGTVFSYLPVKVGDTMNDEKAAAAIKALFVGGTSALCNATATINKFGFLTTASCGSTSIKGSWTTGAS